MALPYENATSGSKALDDIQKILTTYGCQRFGTMTDNNEGHIIVQFNYRGREILVKASIRGYAKAWLDEHPYTSPGVNRCSKEKHQAKAMAQAQISTCSILRDWIKGQITAIEVGLLTFEGAFLGQILLPTGKTVLEAVEGAKMLPPAEGPKALKAT